MSRTVGERTAHSEGEALGESRIRHQIADQLDVLHERMANELVRNGWESSDSQAAAYLLMPLLRDTFGEL